MSEVIRIALFLAVSQVLIVTQAFSHEQPVSSPPPPAAKRLEDVSTFKALTFNPHKGESGTITFRVVEPSIIRIRVYDPNDPELVLNTLVDWKAYPPGKHSVTWDGRDSSGHLVSPGASSIAIDAQPIREPIPGPDTTQAHGEGFHRHNLHDTACCGELSIKLVSPKAGETVRGVVSVEASLAENSPMGYSKSAGNGVRWYVNNRRMHEEITTGTQAFRWQWDTTDLPDGAYKLSVGCCDRNDHRATDSIMVEIKN